MIRIAAPLFLLAACARSVAAPLPAPPPAPAPAPQASASSRWIPARPGEGAALLEAQARVLARAGAVHALAVPFRGRTEEVLLAPGTRVRAGQPVLSVILPELGQAAAAAVSSALRIAAFERRRAQLRSLQAEGLARLQDLSEVEVSLASAQADAQVAGAALRAAGVSPGQARSLAESGGRVQLRSPIDGVLVAVNAVPGAPCEPSAALARVEGGGGGRLEARLSPALAEAREFVFFPAAGAPQPARLISKSEAIDPQDGTVLAWLEPETPLPAGLIGRLRARLGGPGTPVLVPAGSLAWNEGKAAVLRRKGESQETVPVRVLASSGAEALVEGSLQAGEEVAADGPQGAP